MKIYLVKEEDTLYSIAKKFGIKDAKTLRSFHNNFCPLDDLLGHEVTSGKQLLIPTDPKYLKDDYEQNNEQITEVDDGTDTISDDLNNEELKPKSVDQQSQAKEQNNHTNSSEHDGKYFVIQRGTCQCNQGFKFPKFKVTSHQKHYWNDENGEADYLAVTEDDLQFAPPTMPFGNCKLKPSSGGYLPCSYAPSGKWTKTYEKVKVLGKSCVTEISELMCSTGGKITILKHGQQSEIGKYHAMNANSQEQQIYNPVVNFDEFKEEIQDESEDERHAW